MKQSQNVLDAKSLVDPVMGIKSHTTLNRNLRALEDDLLWSQSNLASRL